ncbi:VIT1/CCC1 transporter family protein [Corynebacterium stationis]|uniref:Rubrerythrin family protein n=3 Tax=Corynebacterium stationis TaxID=1705 RepID=A0A177ICK0_9CORY|nr:VIT1/CCC1 transporter family protein [Corynebacterium stationis]NME88424.1 rubrerythrin family protein [Corynebacterium stationis]OAH26523.1 rubrerythrin family protein [Corynebacterium stationis]WLP87137.1 VIT1/CCC1 transporter family protein [Corynebacterium stationis]
METMEQPTRQQIARWRKYLANERAEAAVYRELARKKKGEERDILLKLADAESRHEQYWQEKLGEYVGMPQKPDLNTQFMGWMAKNFGSVFTLALMQSAESRTPYLDDEDASEQLAADERVHAEVVRGLAIQGREKISGSFRAAVFGANDGLVSNLALVIGVMGSGAPTSTLLLTGVSGLLAGALSMAAGEYVSVKSQGELLEASRPAAPATQLAGELDVDANELALIYRARGMSHDEAEAKAQTVFHVLQERTAAADASSHAHAEPAVEEEKSHGIIGEAWSAALSSFCFFATGALIPIIPFIFGMDVLPGAIVAIVLVSLALMTTGGITGLISGKPPLLRALRQLAIGLGAAGITYLLGLLFA